MYLLHPCLLLKIASTENWTFKNPTTSDVPNSPTPSSRRPWVRLNHFPAQSRKNRLCRRRHHRLHQLHRPCRDAARKTCFIKAKEELVKMISLSIASKNLQISTVSIKSGNLTSYMGQASNVCLVLGREPLFLQTGPARTRRLISANERLRRGSGALIRPCGNGGATSRGG